MRRLEQKAQPMTTIIVPCPACQGEGRDIRYSITYEAGCNHAHMGEVDYGICDVCKGSGSVEEETSPRTLADLEQEDFDFIQAKLEPH